MDTMHSAEGATRQDIIDCIKWDYRSLFKKLNSKSAEHAALWIPVNSYLPSLEQNFISNAYLHRQDLYTTVIISVPKKWVPDCGRIFGKR